MSDQDFEEPQAPSRAEAVDIRAADWMLAKRLAETWSAQDQAALDAWLAESSAHLLAYWRLDDAWGRAHRLKALRPSMRKLTGPKGRQAKPYVLGLAAVLVIGAILGTPWLAQFRSASAKTYATPVGGHLSLAMADGSKIELNTNTVLSLSMSASKRFAVLRKGEAFFEIKHDAAHPFVVSVGDHRVTDLGTKFLVRSDNAGVRVALIEGSARFESTRTSVATQSTDLAPGDVVVATSDSMSVSKKSTKELKNTLGWRRGVLVFDNTTLSEAASELNRYNTEKITISDPAVAQLTIGGTFPENDVPALLNTARQVFGLNVRRQGGEIVISR